MKKFITSLFDNPIVFIISYIVVGWIYIFIWTRTKYWDPSYDLLAQPNLFWAAVPPWIIISLILLNSKSAKKEMLTESNELIGGRVLTHVLVILAFSLFLVLCMFGMMLIGFIVFGFVAIMLGFGH